MLGFIRTAGILHQTMLLSMRIEANFSTFADIQQKGGHTMRIEANFATFADIEQKQKGGYTRL